MLSPHFGLGPTWICMSTLLALGFKMAVTKPEAKITLERQKIATRLQLLPQFTTMPDFMTLPPLPDDGGLQKF